MLHHDNSSSGFNLHTRSQNARRKVVIDEAINALNKPVAGSLPNSYTMRLVPDTPTIIPNIATHSPQFISTLTPNNTNSMMKQSLNRAMAVNNQLKANKQKELDFGGDVISQWARKMKEVTKRIVK